MTSAADFHGFAQNYISMPEDMTMPNGGLIFVNDQLPNYESLTQECYNILNDGYGKIRPDRGHDEIVLGILNYKFSLNVELLPMIYNCPIGGKQTNKAVILHFMGPNKIWKNPILFNMFPQFKNNYNFFVKNGGTPYSGELLLGNEIFDSNFGFLQSYHMIKYTLDWDSMLGDLYLNLPNGVIQSNVMTKPFIKYYIKKLCTKEIYYEISCVEGKALSKFISFNITSPKLINTPDIKKQIKDLSWLISFDFIDTPEKISIQKAIRNKDVSSCFLLFLNLTLDYLINIISHDSVSKND